MVTSDVGTRLYCVFHSPVSGGSALKGIGFYVGTNAMNFANLDAPFGLLQCLGTWQRCTSPRPYSATSLHLTGPAH